MVRSAFSSGLVSAIAAYVSFLPVLALAQNAETPDAEEEDPVDDFCSLVGVGLRFDYVSPKEAERKPIPKPVADWYKDRCRQNAARNGLLSYHKQFGTAKSAAEALQYIQQKSFGNEEVDGAKYAAAIPDHWNMAVKEIERYLLAEDLSSAQVLERREKWQELQELPSVKSLGNALVSLRKRMRLGQDYLLLAEATRSPKLLQRGAKLVSWYGTASRFGRSVDASGNAEKLLVILWRRYSGEGHKKDLLPADLANELQAAYLRLDFYRNRSNLEAFDKVAAAANHPDFKEYAAGNGNLCVRGRPKTGDGTAFCERYQPGYAVTYYYYVGLAAEIVSEDFYFLSRTEQWPQFMTNGVNEESFLREESEEGDAGRFSMRYADYRLARFRISYDNEMEDCLEAIADGDKPDAQFSNLISDLEDMEPAIDPVKQVSQYRSMASYYIQADGMAKKCEGEKPFVDFESKRLKAIFKAYLKNVK